MDHLEYLLYINAWLVYLNIILFGGKLCWIQAVKWCYLDLKYL